MTINRELLNKGRFLLPGLVACITFVTGNEAVFPTALVMTLLCITLTLNRSSGDGTDGANTRPLGVAGSTALFVFSTFIALSSVFVPVILAVYAGSGLSYGWPDEAFTHALAARLHAFAYLTALLLIVSIACIAWFRWMQSGSRLQGSRLRAGPRNPEKGD